MSRYGKISTGVSTALVLFWLWCMWSGGLDFTIYPASDGSGGNPSILIAIGLGLIVGIPLLHSSVLVARAVSNDARNTPLARKLATLHVVLWVALGGGLFLPGIAKDRWLLSQSQVDDGSYTKALEAIEFGSLVDFETYYPQALAGLRTQDDQQKFRDLAREESEKHARLDIMKSLRDKGVAFAEADRAYIWEDGMLEVLSAEVKPQDTLRAVQWLIDQGKSLGLSPRVDPSAYLAYRAYNNIYSHVDDPATKELIEVLVENGWDRAPCSDGGACPVVSQAGANNLAAVRYLLEHGAPVDQKAPRSNETPLSAAIYGSYPQMVKLLLDAGARLTFATDRNDILVACDPERAEFERLPSGSKQVLQVLHDANIRMSAQDLARYDQPITNPAQAECVKTFM